MSKVTIPRSAKQATPAKPDKPYDGFPLFPHATKRWAKKVRGKLHYFGPWDDPDGALNRWLEERDDLLAGRQPRPKSDELDVRSLCNRFLSFKKDLLANGELHARTFSEYHECCAEVLDAFGKSRAVTDLRSEDFERLRSTLAKRLGPIALGNRIQRVRCLFKYAYDASLIESPIRFGPGFKRPSRKTLRLERAAKQHANGLRMFESTELRTIIKSASMPLKAMILLGVNCGFGQSDLSQLPISAIDLKAGLVNYPRPKTGIGRRCFLWPKTLDAIRDGLAMRPEPADEANNPLAFLTAKGHRFVRVNGDGAVNDDLAQAFTRLTKRLGFHRPGKSFYALRHTFQTIAEEAGDLPAVAAIMGHVDGTMAGHYRERISDERLKAVTDHVHDWLFPKEKKGSAKQGKVSTTSKAKASKGKEKASRRKQRGIL